MSQATFASPWKAWGTDRWEGMAGMVEEDEAQALFRQRGIATATRLTTTIATTSTLCVFLALIT